MTFASTRCAQVHLAALQEAYKRACSLTGAEQEAALELFGQVGQRITHSYAGFVAGAAASLAQIVRGGMSWALQARMHYLERASPNRPSPPAFFVPL